MKKILFIFIYILFNTFIAFGNDEEYKTSTGEVIKVEAKQVSIEELNKDIKKAEIEQLKNIIKNDSNLKIELIGEFKKSTLNLNSFLENYYLNKKNIIEKKEGSHIDINKSNKILDKTKLQPILEEESNLKIFKYLSILNFILIICLFSFYLYNNKKRQNKD